MKPKLREDFRKKRAALTPEEVAKKSAEICQNFIKNLLPRIYFAPSSFSLYLASANEASPATLAEFFTENKIEFAYPKIIQQNQPLEFILAEKNLDFAANQFYPKILEPINGKKILPDFLILPLLAFDDDLSRLGMGGGFFDRTIEKLKTQKPNVITIGLAYDFQRAGATLPIENTDQKLDFVVTEKNIFARS